MLSQNIFNDKSLQVWGMIKYNINFNSNTIRQDIQMYLASLRAFWSADELQLVRSQNTPGVHWVRVGLHTDRKWGRSLPTITLKTSMKTMQRPKPTKANTIRANILVEENIIKKGRKFNYIYIYKCLLSLISKSSLLKEHLNSCKITPK